MPVAGVERVKGQAMQRTIGDHNQSSYIPRHECKRGTEEHFAKPLGQLGCRVAAGKKSCEAVALESVIIHRIRTGGRRG